MRKSRVVTRKVQNYQGGTMTREGVLCRCGKFEPFGVYAVAQMTMGHALTRNCDCGNEITVQDFDVASEKKAAAT